MHALVLLPIRPTLLGGVPMVPQTSPLMTVRMVPAEDANSTSQQTAVSAARDESSANAALLVGAVTPVAATKAAALDGAARPARPVAPLSPVAAVAAGTRPFTGTPAGASSALAVTTPLSSSASTPAPVAAPGLPPAPAYLPGGKLDPGPRPLHDIEPAYPAEANLRSGSVVLRLLVSAAGEVDEVAVVRSFPQGLFEASALAAFGEAKFSPGLMLGIPVKSQITIEVQFTPINRGATVSGRSY